MNQELMTLDFWQDTVIYEGKTLPVGTLACFLKRSCPPISLFFEKSGITIVERAKHLPITAGVSYFLNTMNGGFL